jgi:hypothetical protein
MRLPMRARGCTFVQFIFFTFCISFAFLSICLTLYHFLHMLTFYVGMRRGLFASSINTSRRGETGRDELGPQCF